MKAKRKIVNTVGALFLLALTVFLLTPVQAQAYDAIGKGVAREASDPDVTGWVFTPEGDPLPGAMIHSYEWATGNHEQWPADESGYFELWLPEGEYDIWAEPTYDLGKLYTGSIPQYIHVTTYTGTLMPPNYGLNFKLTYPSFTGIVLRPDSQPFMGCADVELKNPDTYEVYDYQTYCGYEGHPFRIGGVPDGDYWLMVTNIDPVFNYAPPEPLSVTVATASQYDPNATQFVDLQLQVSTEPQPDPVLKVEVFGPEGNPVIAEVHLWNDILGIDIWQRAYVGIPAHFWEIPLNEDYQIQAWPIGTHIPELANSHEQIIFLDETAIPINIGLQLQSSNVTGVVETPAGDPLPLAFGCCEEPLKKPAEVMVHNADWTFEIYAMTNISGEFGLLLPADQEYILEAYPQGTLANLYTQSMPEMVFVPAGRPNATNPIHLPSVKFTYPRIEGVVVGPENTKYSAWVETWREDWDYVSGDDTLVDPEAPDIFKPFRLGGMPAGHYFVQSQPPYEDPALGISGIEAYTVTVGSQYQITATEWMTLYVGDILANVVGKLEYPLGHPAAWADIRLSWPNPDDPDCAFEMWTGTNEEGEFAFFQLEPGISYKLQGYPAEEQKVNWEPSDPETFMLATPDDLYTTTLTLKPAFRPKVITGTVTDDTGNPVVNAKVIAQEESTGNMFKTLTGADGYYELGVKGGIWRVWVEPTTPTSEWYFDPAFETWVEFEKTPDPESAQVDFTVFRFDQGDFFAVSGKVLKPDGSMPPAGVEAYICNDVGKCFGGQVDETDGVFTIWVKPGFYYLWIEVDPASGYLPPHNNGEIEVEVFEDTELGTFKLVEKKPAKVKGQVINTATGQGIPGILIEAWTEEGDWAETTTITGGLYVLDLSPGHWHGGPILTPEQEKQYVVLPPTRRRGLITTDGATGQDFYLRKIDAMMRGQVVSVEAGEVITDINAVVYAEVCNEKGCFNIDSDVIDGNFTLNVVGGFTYTVGIWFPEGGYMPGPDVPAEVAIKAGETVTGTLSVLEAGTKIQGYLLDAELNPVYIDAEVSTHAPMAAYGGPQDEWFWVDDRLWPEKDPYKYNLYVPTPNAETGTITWTVNLWVDPSTGYIADPSHPRYEVVINPGTETVPEILYVKQLEDVIQGVVKLPNDEAAPYLWVFAEGEIGDGVITETLLFEAETDASGVFTMPVLPGEYEVGVYLPPQAKQTFFPPKLVQWGSNADNPVELVLRHKPTSGDSVISGALSFEGMTPVIPPEDGILVLGWAEDGSYSWVTGTTNYQLPIITGTTWHVLAIAEDTENDNYYFSDEVVIKDGDPKSGIDLVLHKAKYMLPDPECWTFDASKNKRLELPARSDLFAPLIDIPANTMPVTGTVQICATPGAALPSGHRVVGFGYELEAWDSQGKPITANFNKNIRLQFYLPEDANTEEIEGVYYYSTVRDEWMELTDTYIDAEDQFVTGKVNHFTKFGVLSEPPGGQTATNSYIYLPLVLRNSIQ